MNSAIQKEVPGRSILEAEYKKIKENAKTKDARIIIVTGRGEQSDRLVGFEVGADEYVAKPVSLAYLKRTIGKLLP